MDIKIWRSISVLYSKGNYGRPFLKEKVLRIAGRLLPDQLRRRTFDSYFPVTPLVIPQKMNININALKYKYSKNCTYIVNINII